MSKSLETTPETEDALLQSMCLPSREELVAKTLQLGLVMRRAPQYDITHPALTLTPFTIRKEVLQTLLMRQQLWNEAVDRTARQYQVLHEVLQETAHSDADFTGHLVRILDQVYLSAEAKEKENYQSYMLGIFRTDYMRSINNNNDDNNNNSEKAEDWKNVEINTISCSFAGLSPLVNEFHRYLIQYQNLLRDGNNNNNNNTMTKEIEQSTSGEAIPHALATAVEAWTTTVAPLAALSKFYFQSHSTTTQQPLSSLLIPVVMVIIQEGERNTGDQYQLLFNVLKQYNVLPLRRTHQQIHDSMELIYFNPESKEKGAARAPFLILEKQYVVAVAYYRSAYVPTDYNLYRDNNNNNKELLSFEENPRWQARLQIEASNAIKCPSIPYHLLTLKKLQQVMTNIEGFLSPISFENDIQKANTLAQHFMPQYSLNEKEYDPNHNHNNHNPEYYIQRAIENPETYVLKPQLEGGGNLYAGEEMQQLLKTSKETDKHLFQKIRKEFILMEKICYPKADGVLLRQERVFTFKEGLCSELGIYGVLLTNGINNNNNNNNKEKEFLINGHGGYVVRTKPSDVEDGGVMAGVACLDSALVYE